MCDGATAIKKRVADILEDLDGTVFGVEFDRPGRVGLGFGRSIDASGNAVFALRAVKVFFEVGTAEIGDEIGVRRLQDGARDIADGVSQLAVDEVRDGFVVFRETPTHLFIAEGEISAAGAVTIIAAQGADVKRMKKIGNGDIALLKSARVPQDAFLPLLATTTKIVGFNKDIGFGQNPPDVEWQLFFQWSAGRQARKKLKVFVADPEGPNREGGGIFDPDDAITGQEIVGEMDTDSFVGREFTVPGEPARGIDDCSTQQLGLAHEMRRSQVIRLFVKQTVIEVGRQSVRSHR